MSRLCQLLNSMGITASAGLCMPCRRSCTPDPGAALKPNYPAVLGVQSRQLASLNSSTSPEQGPLVAMQYEQQPAKGGPLKGM